MEGKHDHVARKKKELKRDEIEIGLCHGGDNQPL